MEEMFNVNNRSPSVWMVMVFMVMGMVVVAGAMFSLNFDMVTKEKD